MEIVNILKGLAETPVPTILVIAGILFLFIALGGQFGAKIVTDKMKTKAAGILGIILLLIGITIFLSQDKQAPKVPDGMEVEKHIAELETAIERNENEQREINEDIGRLEPLAETNPDAQNAIENHQRRLEQLKREREQLEQELKHIHEQR